MKNLSVPGGASLGSYLYGVVFHFECMVWGNGTYVGAGNHGYTVVFDCGGSVRAFQKIHCRRADTRHASSQRMSNTSNRVIAISREFGSGGRTIGKEVAIKLAIPCCDSDLIEKISMETRLAKEYVEKMKIMHSRPVFMIMQCQLENRMDNLFQTRCGWHRKSCHRPCKKRFLRNCWALCRLYFAGYCGLHDRVYPRLRREKGRAHCYCIRRKRGISRAATA